MANAIVHFEIPADDVPRAIAFYAKAFGWKISDPMKMNYFFVETMKKGELGINGGLMARAPGQTFMNYVGVASIDAALAKVTAAGGTVVAPKTEIGQGMGSTAVFTDTEGNVVGLYQPGKPAPAKKPAKKKAAKKAARKPAKKKAAKKNSSKRK